MLASRAHLIQEAVHQLQLVPFFCVALLWARSHFPPARPVDAKVWCLAIAYLIGWCADWIAFGHLTHNITFGNFYPLAQCLVLGVALLHDRRIATFSYVLVITAAVTIRWPSPVDTDVLLRTVAWLSVAVLGWRAQDLNLPLRLSFVLSYGVGWGLWVIYLMVRAYYMTPQGWRGGWFATWVPYLSYQAVYLLGALVFCVGAVIRSSSPEEAAHLPGPARQDFSLKL